MYNPAHIYPGIRLRQPHTSRLPQAPRPAMSPLVTTHGDPFPMEMAFAEPSWCFPRTPILCVSAFITVPCPALAASAACKCAQGFIAGPPDATSPCSPRAMLFASHCNPHPMAPRIIGDLSPLFLQVILLLPRWTRPCSR